MRKNKILSLIITLVLVMSLALTGCNGNDNSGNSNTPDNKVSENNEPANNNEEAGDTEEPSDNEETGETEEPADEEEGDAAETEEPAEEDEEESTYDEASQGNSERDAIEDAFKWELEKVYASRDAYMLDLSEAELLVNKLENLESKFTTSYNHFADTLTTYEQANRLIAKLYVFATLQAHTDTTNTSYSELEDLASTLNSDFSEKTSYIMPAIVHMDQDALTDYMTNEDMASYKSLVDSILREKDHILSDAEEKILGQAQILSEIPESIYDAYKYQTAIEEFLPEPNWGKWSNGTSEEKQEVLDAYFKKTNVGLDLIAEIYESEIKKATFFAKARNFDSALESALLSDGVTMQEYETIFKITHDNLDILHRWIEMRKDILGLEEKVYQADLYAQLVPGSSTTMSFENAQKYIATALEPLGEQYIADLNEGFNSRWCDVYPTSTKYEGGYQWGTYDTDPFVLLNFSGSMNDVSTVAHEMGHALNAKYSNAKQSYFDAGVPIFNAEIASTTNEALLLEYRLERAKSPSKKQEVLIDYISLIENTIFTQMIYADFEKRAYETYDAGTPLNAEVFNEIMNEVYQEYYGPSFVTDHITGQQWAEIPHFYNAFYVYKYATGLSAGLSFSDKVLNGTDEDLQKYLDFLAGGSSKPSLDLLRDAGVDFSTGQPLQQAFDRFEQLLDEFEATLQ